MSDSQTVESCAAAVSTPREKMRPWRVSLLGVLAVAALFSACMSAPAQAYRVRPLSRPSPKWVGDGGTLTIQASPAFVNFALVSGGTAQGSSGVTITTSWNVLGILPTLEVDGFFTSSTAALTDGRSPAHLIPSSAVLGQVTTGVPTSYTPFTQTTTLGTAGAGLQLVNTNLGLLVLTGNRTDVLNLQINLSGVSNLPAGTYTGTLTIQATMN